MIFTRCIGAVVCCVALVCSSARADVLRVPEQFGSVQAAINASVAGDTVLVGPGSWGRINLSGKDITLRSTSGPWATHLNGGGVDPVVHINGFNNITIEGFMIRDGVGVQGQQGGGMYAFTSSGGHLVLRKCVIYNNVSMLGPGGVYIANASTTIENCHFENNRCNGNDVGGLQLAGGGPHLVVGTVFENNYSWFEGPALKAGASNSSRVTSIIGCTFWNNTSGTAGYTSISAGTSWTPIRIYNSIVRSPNGSVDSWLADVQVRSSNMQALPGGFDYGGNIDAEPLFVDAAGSDFRLQAGSPGIDAGDSTITGGSFPGEDFWGAARSANDPDTFDAGVSDAQGGVVDMGAYEYQSDCNGNNIYDAAEVSGPFPGSGSSLQFDGVSGVAVVDTLNQMSAGVCTIEFWQYAQEARDQSSFGIINCNDQSERIQAHVPAASGLVYWDHGDIGAQWYARLAHRPSPQPRVTQRWDHWAFVIEPSTNSAVIYRNGQVVEKRVGWGTYPGNAWKLVIGALGDPASGCNFWPFKGLIDEFRVWNVARTEAEIRGSMSMPLIGDELGLIAYYPFDEGSGDTTANASLNVNQLDAQLRGGVTWHDPSVVDGNGNGIPDECDDCDGNGLGDDFETGRVANSIAAIGFDGVSGRAISNGNANFSLAGQSFSVEGWVFRGEKTGQEEYFFFHGTEAVANQGLVTGFRADDRFVFAFWGNDLETVRLFPPDAKWHHWACTYDAATNERVIYVDGEAVAWDVSPSDFLGTGPISAGALLTLGEMNGLVDELRVWDHARSQAQIQADMFTSFIEGPIPPELHAYWPANNTNGEWWMFDWAGGNDLVPQGGADYFYFSADCNNNGVPDLCDPDSDGDGVPDDCDCGDGSPEDCNGNGVQDGCDIADGTSQDCNGNGIPDECDIASGTSQDCDGNGVPDECDPDCNGNGVPDGCDIADGTSTDTNGNGVPDECDRVYNVTQDTYWSSIQAAVDNADSGDVIELVPEEFGENVTVSAVDVTIRSLDPSDPSTVAATRLTGEIWSQGGISLTLEGLAIRGRAVVIESFLHADRCLVNGATEPVWLGSFGYLHMSRCVLWGASTAITVDAGLDNEVRLDQCIVAGNQTGILAYGWEDQWVSVNLNECTFVDNTVGVEIFDYPFSELRMSNSILRDAQPVFHDGQGSFDSTVQYSNIRGGWAGAGNIDVEPIFVDPDGPDNDPGTVQDNDYRLAVGSPGIDAASNLLVAADAFDLDNDGNTTEPTPLDLDNAPRFYDDAATPDTGISGNGYTEVVDMGPYEFQGNPCPADFNGDGSVDTLDFLSFLNAFNGGDPRADFNGDGGIDTLDFLAFLNAFVVGC